MARTPWAPGTPALAGAARVVEAVVSRGQSADALPAERDNADRAAVRAIALGTLRWYLRLAPAVESLLSDPSRVTSIIRALLVTAAHQVEYSRNAPQAIVNTTVDAARLLGAPQAAGLVNAVLRRFVAEREVLLARVDESLPGRTAHPAWLAGQIAAAWPERAAGILDANNVHPPMTLRIDLSRTSRDEYRRLLADAGIESQEIQWMPSAVTLTRPIPVAVLPGFADGLASVQDAGAQVAAGLAELSPGMRVLDACAAPGGKTGHLLEASAGAVELTALDIDAGRVALIEENLRRLKRTARVLVGDARDPGSFWDGRPYDFILVDAPCSSTGVIRRHPDIKLLRRPGDLPAFASGQLAILRAAVAMLSPGRRLLYSTCSVLAEENEQVIGRLLEAEPAMAARQFPSPAPGAVHLGAGWQLFPGAQAGTDGFYYACLENTTTGT